MYYANGNFYKVEWSNDKYEGQGEIQFLSGRFYKGGWKDGMKHGEGMYKWPDGQILTETLQMT